MSRAAGEIDVFGYLNRLWGYLPRVTRRTVLEENYDGIVEARVKCTAAEANIMTSELLDSPGLHAPVIDIDFGASLVPSSTPGHHHLILERAMTWRRYKRLIRALARAGIIERGYARATLARGYSSIRLPWVKKNLTNTE